MTNQAQDATETMTVTKTTETETKLRVRVRRVPHERDDCRVRRAVVERLAPHGHWVPVESNEDPVTAHERDTEAARLAASWLARPATGYAAWTAEGPTWVEPFAEGDRWTTIPTP